MPTACSSGGRRGTRPLLARLEYRLFRPGLAFPETADPRILAALAREMERNQRERLEPSPLVARELEEVRARISRAGHRHDALTPWRTSPQS